MENYNNQIGPLEVIVGPMFAGKTEELIRRAKRLDYAHKQYLVFKPKIDNRYSDTDVVSHNKKALKAIPIDKIEDIEKFIEPKTEAIIIDEVQFFKGNVKEFVKKLQTLGLRVIAGGLDMDFRGEPFGIIGDLLSMADEVLKLTAICSVCGENASRTQRIIGGMPAYYDDPIVLVGEKESYEPRCRCHHIVLFGKKNEQ